MKPMYPLPEAILPDSWQIVPGVPRCDLRKRQMWLELSDDPQWATVRAHELAHVRFTPENARKPRTIRMETLQAVEDMRVNHLAQNAGVDFSAGGPTHILQGACLFSKNNLRAATLLLASALDQADLERLTSMLGETGTSIDVLTQARNLADQAQVRMAHGRYRDRSLAPWSYGRTLRVAKWLDEQFSQRQIIPGRGTPAASKRSDGLPVGAMHMEYPPLTASTAHRNIGSTDEGAILRAPWRVTTDQRVFRITKVPRSGSVLIDASGSMSLTPRQVAAIAATVPAGIVAAYGADCISGPLRILGKHGRVAADPAAYDFGGCNVIDIPALEWLATQPKPRVWISDGQVTGINDQLNDKVTARAHEIVRDAQIAMVPNVNAACALLRARRYA